MIKTIADLLNGLLALELKALDQSEISHPPTIGAMYEGLTREILDKALPTRESLQVVSGFARGEDGTLSNELDCMLVRGPMEDVPKTDKKIASIENVIAVIQVKKKLYRDDIQEGFENLRSVVDLKISNNVPVPPIFRTAFEALTGVSLGGNPSPRDLPNPLKTIYSHLLIESVKPARILLGYHGYGGEDSFRTGLLTHLKELVGKKGHGPRSFPNLILNQHAVVMKANGMPWGAKIELDGWWHLLHSSGTIPPVFALLECIWSRLNYLGLAGPAIFGEDLEIEVWNRLLDVRLSETGAGWECQPYPGKISGLVALEGDASESWSPHFLNLKQYVLILYLCHEFEIDLDNPPPGFATDEALPADIAELVQMGLIGQDPLKPKVYRLLTKLCVCAILSDGRYAVGENISGRMERWILRFIEKQKKRKEIGDADADISN